MNASHKKTVAIILKFQISQNGLASGFSLHMIDASTNILEGDTSMKGTALLSTDRQKVIVLEEVDRQTFNDMKSKGGFTRWIQCEQMGETTERVWPVRFIEDEIDWTYGY